MVLFLVLLSSLECSLEAAVILSKKVGWFAEPSWFEAVPYFSDSGIAAVSYVWVTDARIYISCHWKASSFFISFYFQVFYNCIYKWVSRVPRILTNCVNGWNHIYLLLLFENDHSLARQVIIYLNKAEKSIPLFFFFYRRAVISHKVCRWYFLFLFPSKT